MYFLVIIYLHLFYFNAFHRFFMLFIDINQFLF